MQVEMGVRFDYYLSTIIKTHSGHDSMVRITGIPTSLRYGTYRVMLSIPKYTNVPPILVGPVHTVHIKQYALARQTLHDSGISKTRPKFRTCALEIHNC